MTVIEQRDGRWVRRLYGGFFIEHLDGIPWPKAPLPQRLHRCQAQTRTFTNAKHVERCACGAIRYGTEPYWDEKNSRRDGWSWMRRQSR